MRSRTQARSLLRLTAPTRTNGSSSNSSSSSNSVATSTSSSSPSLKDHHKNSSGNSRSSLRPRSNSNTSSSPGESLSCNPRRVSSSPSSSSSLSASPSASPPPTALPQLIWQSFFSAGRPLLELNALPSKLNNKNIFSDDYQTNVPHWRTKVSRITPERFSSLLDSLSSSSDSSSTRSSGRNHNKSSPSSTSALVKSVSRALHSEQADEKDRKRAISLALERGEDPTLAASLGSESELVVLGEPNGPSPEWSKGVATFLAEHTRAFQPPPPPTPSSSSTPKQRKLTSKSTVYLTDDDPSLMLSHALIQSSLPQALEWDRLTSLMDSAAQNDKSLERKGINLKAIKEILNDKSLGFSIGQVDVDVDGSPQGKIISLDELTKEAEENGWILLAGNELEMLDDEKDQVRMDSVKRKRKTKMRKHKYRKLRKRQRSERQRMKK